jgi:hypothetical protein
MHKNGNVARADLSAKGWIFIFMEWAERPFSRRQELL